MAIQNELKRETNKENRGHPALPLSPAACRFPQKLFQYVLGWQFCCRPVRGGKG